MLIKERKQNASLCAHFKDIYSCFQADMYMYKRYRALGREGIEKRIIQGPSWHVTQYVWWNEL